MPSENGTVTFLIEHLYVVLVFLAKVLLNACGLMERVGLILEHVLVAKRGRFWPVCGSADVGERAPAKVAVQLSQWR